MPHIWNLTSNRNLYPDLIGICQLMYFGSLVRGHSSWDAPRRLQGVSESYENNQGRHQVDWSAGLTQVIREE